MAIEVGDIVRKTTGTQKYKVVEKNDTKCKCILEPNTCPMTKFTFDESDLVKVS